MRRFGASPHLPFMADKAVRDATAVATMVRLAADGDEASSTIAYPTLDGIATVTPAGGSPTIQTRGHDVDLRWSPDGHERNGGLVMSRTECDRGDIETDGDLLPMAGERSRRRGRASGGRSAG
jgi:hypothetical protein